MSAASKNNEKIMKHYSSTGGSVDAGSRSALSLPNSHTLGLGEGKNTLLALDS